MKRYKIFAVFVAIFVCALNIAGTDRKILAGIQSVSGGVLFGLTNYPNPFAAGQQSTKIVYTLTKDCDVCLTIYNPLGDLIRKLEFASGSEGGKGTVSGYQNVVSWDGKNGAGMITANGAYACRIVATPSDGSRANEGILKIGVLK